MNPPKNRKRRALIALILLLGGWWAYDRLTGDDRPARARELRAQLSGEAGRNLPPDKRRELWKELGATMKQLTPAQRLNLSKEREKEFEKRLAAYFRLPRQQQIAYLDRQINEMEARRKEWERAAKAKGKGGTALKGGPPGKGTFGPKDPEARERARKLRLDQSTPEARAQRAEYFRQLTQRRQQRGLPVIRRSP
ncbi:MAG: hypothetical protein L0Z62_25855 [Gemmataceae bacterium]|nr:hypothetical protein [Gemmataceae bacterium]